MGKVNNSKAIKYYDVAGGDSCNGNHPSPTPTPGAVIDDDSVANNKTWSSAKIIVEIQKAISGETTILYDGGDATKEEYDVIYDGGESNNPNTNNPIYDGGSAKG